VTSERLVPLFFLYPIPGTFPFSEKMSFSISKEGITFHRLAHYSILSNLNQSSKKPFVTLNVDIARTFLKWLSINLIKNESSLPKYSLFWHIFKEFCHRKHLVYLKSSLRKVYGRYHSKVDRYEIYVSHITTDMFHLS